MTRLGTLVLVAVCVVLLPLASGAADPRRVMVFGDSLSWGWMPVADGPPAKRFPPAVRWPGVLQAELGAGYLVIEEALNGRTTTISPSPNPIPLAGAGLNGADYLPAALGSHQPLDLVVILLGTNDLWADPTRSAVAIGQGAMALVAIVRGATRIAQSDYPAPMVLLIAPPPVPPLVRETVFAPAFAAGIDTSGQFGSVYGALAAAAGIAFLDAGRATTVDGADGVHFTAENHRALGRAVAVTVRELLPPGGSLP